MKVASTRRGKMDSTPGRSGDSHPRRLVEERREEYVLPCPALPQLKFVRWIGEDSSRAEVREFFLFWWLVQQVPGIHDIFSSVSFH